MKTFCTVRIPLKLPVKRSKIDGGWGQLSSGNGGSWSVIYKATRYRKDLSGSSSKG